MTLRILTPLLGETTFVAGRQPPPPKLPRNHTAEQGRGSRETDKFSIAWTAEQTPEWLAHLDAIGERVAAGERWAKEPAELSRELAGFGELEGVDPAAEAQQRRRMRLHEIRSRGAKLGAKRAKRRRAAK